MKNEYVKTPAIPFVGYRYQTLHGIAQLVSWLESPASYSRMRFECDDKSIAPQGLDDIVMERVDGLVDYQQVKYTPPEAVSGCVLTWDWLLSPTTKAENSRSFIQKWSAALAGIPPERLGSASLITNRTPDRAVEESLEGEHLSFDLAPIEAQAALELQLGSADAARSFLRTLKVRHSEHSFSSLEEAITARLAAMGFHSGGIARLLAKAPDWASFKDEPPPDGWVTLEAVRGELSLAQPAPMPQDFEIPSGYEPPDQLFHQTLIKEILSNSVGLVTLVGPPGRGKSTYVSFLCEQLAEMKVPVIRHHYFLSLGDRSGDRLSPARIARSLLSQISQVAGTRLRGSINVDKAEELASVLEQCGQAYARDNVPFVVVIDGLDHVWRDNRGDVRPLDELFRQLLPLPPNVMLLVGTQPVDDDRLPDRLLSNLPRTDWRELPPMTCDAVHGYVMRQVRAGRWQTRSQLNEAEVANCSLALHVRTHGHPLHVIYSVEDLLGRTSHPSEDDIRVLPDCPGDDIRTYYRALWNKLKYSQRDVLHLMSALSFRWPRDAFEEMSSGKDPGLLTLEGVRHLLFDTGLGLQLFHESLVVFIKEEADHQACVAKLMPRAETWLRNHAPARLKNTWHWLVQANLGDTQPLRQGLTREWLLDRLVEGYPVEAMVRLLTRAEDAAFLERAFGEAYRHRSLKTRLLSGPKYQLDNPSRLLRVSWALSADESLSQDAFVTRHQLNTPILPLLALALKERGNDVLAREACRYAVKRWNSELQLNSSRLNRDGILERLSLTDAVIQSGAIQRPESLAKELKHVGNWGAAKLVGYLLKHACLPLIIEVWRETTDIEKRRMLEDAACETAAFAGGDISSWEEFAGFMASTLAANIAYLKGVPFAAPACSPLHADFDKSTDLDVRNDKLCNLVREWFLKSLATALYSQGEFEWLPAPVFKYRENLTECLDVLAEFALVAAAALASGNAVSFEAVFEHFEAQVTPSNVSYQQKEAFNGFRRGLLQVALDCHLLSMSLGGNCLVEIRSWKAAQATSWLHSHQLPGFALRKWGRVFSRDIIRDVLNDQSAIAVRELQETCTIAQDLLELCELALHCDERELAKQILRQSWDITIGYGHRKDPALDEVLCALEYLSDVAPTTTRQLLSSIAPQVASITRFTDGSGTRHIPSSASELLAKLDRAALATRYDEQVMNGEWHDANASMKHLLASASQATPALIALAKTGLSQEEYGSPTGTNGILAQVASVACTHQGGLSASHAEPGHPPATEDGETKVNFSDYPPRAFDKLIAELEDKRGVYGSTLHNWFLYWKAKGKSSALVKYVRPIILTQVRHSLRFNSVLNELFDTCIELEGASDGAFEVAIRVQIENGGWLNYFERTKTTEERLAKVAKLFPHRADEFICRSTVQFLTSDISPSELIVPGEALVFLLVELGRLPEAIDLATSMAECVIADTSGLDLPQPAWA